TTHFFQPESSSVFNACLPANCFPAPSKQISALLTNISGNFPNCTAFLFRECFQSKSLAPDKFEQSEEEGFPKFGIKVLRVVRMWQEKVDQNPHQILQDLHGRLVVVNVDTKPAPR